MAACIAVALVAAAGCAVIPQQPHVDSTATQYSVHWPSLLPEPGKNKKGLSTYLNSMPLGNGHMAANILYDSNRSSVVALVAASSAWAADGELIKVALLEVKLEGNVAELPAAVFAQTLDPQTATWTLAARGKPMVSAYIDANSDSLVLNATAAMTLSLRPLRVDAESGVGPQTPTFSCQSYDVGADHAGGSGKQQFVYHRNANCSGANDYMTTTLVAENIPKADIVGMRNPLHLRATGAAAHSSADGRTVAVAMLTDDTGTSTAVGFEAALHRAASTALLSAGSPAMKASHDSWWAERWASHFIHVTTSTDENKDGARISFMYCLQRYTQIIQARSPYPIKFNGMLFTANRPPFADHRDWGGLNWWQNLRMPYYNMLQAGDHDMIATLFEQFNRTLPVVRSRTRAYFGFDGYWWPEYTHPLYGTTHPASYGCGRAVNSSVAATSTEIGQIYVEQVQGPEPTWHSQDRWNGFNRQGSLDLSLMILDHYAHTGKDNGYLGIPKGVVEFYWNLWRNTSTAPHKPMVFFPTQAVETWQCPGWPVDPNNCPTNDMPTVAGIHAVLEKLLHHPPPDTTQETLASWTEMRGKLPPLPSRIVNGKSAYIPCADCVRETPLPPSKINCTAWQCSCQRMTDLYGTESAIGFGCAPKEAQYWWSHVEDCNTKTAKPCKNPPAAGCGSGIEKTHEGCCPACHTPAPGPVPTPPPVPTTPGCHHTSNSENAELYSVHPYRMATAARGDSVALAAAQQAFINQVFKGDDGWNQNAMDAALLGNATNAAKYVLARANTPPAKGYRFPTMAPHEQDYEPSSDHFSVMQNAIGYMLMAPADDMAQSVVLLPAWPCEWDVSFKVHAPQQTTISGQLVAGKLSFSVEPADRKAYVTAMECQTT